MMDQPRIGYTGWHDPPANVMPEVKEIEVSVPAGLGVAVEGSASAWPGNETGPGPSLPVLDVFNQQRRYIDVFNRGRTPFAFTASASQPWIVLSASHGTVGSDQRLWVSVDWRKAPKGSGSGTVTVSGAGTGSVAVTVRTFNPEQPARTAFHKFCRRRWLCFDRGRALYAQDRHSLRTLGRNRGLRANPVVHDNIPYDRSQRDSARMLPALQYNMYLFNPGTVRGGNDSCPHIKLCSRSRPPICDCVR